MHVAIDAHVVGERETGNETYTLNLVRALLRNDERRRVNDESGVGRHSPLTLSLLATHPERLRAALPDLPPHARILPVRPGNALLRIPLVLPWLATRHRFDLLHVNYNAPPVKPCPTVVTIHDISFEHYPQFFSPRDLLILKTLVPLSARQAARIITVSEHARREIMTRYGLPAEKIAVTHEAAGEQFRPVADQAALQAVRRKYRLGDGPFILALGNLQPRKNIQCLVEAFGQAVRGRQSEISGQRSHERRIGVGGSSVGPAHQPSPATPTADPLTAAGLVIAGKAQWRESEVYRAVAEAGIADRVRFPGYVEEADLPALYSAATVFVFPSLYEGFGLPPLEAMACGTPVICSNTSSLPEVVGDAAWSFNPTDGESLAQAISTVLTVPGLQADLQARGLRRAAQFSWDRCASETLAVYRDVLAGRLT